MFRQTGFDKLVDKATSQYRMEPDWNMILQICDMIRQNDVQPKQALQAVKKKLTSTNPHTAMFAVELLESMVKNCSVLHEELTTKAYCEVLHDVVKTTAHENVRTKMLELLQAWQFAFRKNPKFSALKDTVNWLKSEGYKFPAMRESDAMFSSDTAPEWADGECCHRCRSPFSLMLRKHHCRACGQVFCAHCTTKSCTLPKYGIEKEVRVCDTCYEQVNKPSSTGASTKDPDMAEYLKSSLAQQSQVPPRKNEDELREEEEFQLALALSQSEAEHKEKEKMRVTSAYHSNLITNNTTSSSPPIKDKKKDRSPSPINRKDTEESSNPELAYYLNRGFWEKRIQNDSTDHQQTMYPSAPSPATPQLQTHQQTRDILAEMTNITNITKAVTMRENGILSSVPSAQSLHSEDTEMEEFVKTLKSQVEIFINRMKSNSSRGRSIATDSSVQTLFMNITAMHSRLLRYIQEHDDNRLHYERLQDKLTQVKDARAALDALRDEHREKLRHQAEEAERQRQLQMAHKLEIMRKKKQEYLQYQRQLALQRIQEQEREMQMRHEQQKQQYMLASTNAGAPVGFIPGATSPVHGAPPVTQSFGPHTGNFSGPTSLVGAPPQAYMGGPAPPHFLVGPPTGVPQPNNGPMSHLVSQGPLHHPAPGQHISLQQPPMPMANSQQQQMGNMPMVQNQPFGPPGMHQQLQSIPPMAGVQSQAVPHQMPQAPPNLQPQPNMQQQLISAPSQQPPPDTANQQNHETAELISFD